MIGYNTLV